MNGFLLAGVRGVSEGLELLATADPECPYDYGTVGYLLWLGERYEQRQDRAARSALAAALNRGDGNWLGVR